MPPKSNQDYAFRLRGQKSLAGYSPWGHKESAMTELFSCLSRGFPGGTSGKETTC